MPINLKPKRQPLAKRLERRARIVSLLKTWIPRLSVALYFVGLGWLLLLPHDQYNKETYVSENALLPAQINVYYGFSDINVAKEYQSKIEERLNQSSLEKARFIETELRAAGFRATIQKFSSPIPHPDDVQQGVNAFGIYHAPRSDGTESLVLSAPWVSRDGRDNINGISLLLSVARMFKRHTYWSKDIIILVTDDGLAGTQAWLDVYHGEQGSHMYPVMPRAGAIQAAVNLDFPGTSEYDSLGIFFEGVNGQLPNLDLVNTVVRVARVTSQIPVTLHDVPEAALRGVAESLGSYFASLSNMLYTMRYQALGHPTGDHGLYLRYKIDAITLYGVPATSGATFGFHRIGALIESTFRSLNNLLEHFHQSFFFYFLSDQERYVSIGMYMPPVILFACSLVFDSLVLWGSSTIPVATGSSNPEQDKDARPQVPFPYSTSRRELAPAFAVLVLAHAAGVLVFFVMRPAFTVWGETWVGDGMIHAGHPPQTHHCRPHLRFRPHRFHHPDPPGRHDPRRVQQRLACPQITQPGLRRYEHRCRQSHKLQPLHCHRPHCHPPLPRPPAHRLPVRHGRPGRLARRAQPPRPAAPRRRRVRHEYRTGR
ncbi:Gaa1-like protein [Jimgerdemannia flammicorona]|uniref:Gaa1-like protein n=1 Tax=Jimgerdemannia flammicorona TaxID=994334 RepID=A0A433DLQ1_9FUNG|nr:Gaa1-like protein [Jimgerdemannia flammicorona]